jgi:hypothetical protein
LSKEKKSDWPELEKALCLSMAFPNISEEFKRKMAETGQGVGRGVVAALFHRAFAAFAATFFGEIQIPSLFCARSTPH